MKQALSLFLSLALGIGSLGPMGAPVLAQQIPEIPRIDMGMGNGAANGAAGAMGYGFKPFLPPGQLSLNDPRFFVLQTLSSRLETLQVTPGRAATKEQKASAFIRNIESILASQEAMENPSSPDSIAMQTLVRALESPDRIAALAPTLRSVNPQLGETVLAQLKKTVLDFHASGGNASMLRRLEQHVERLERLSAAGAASGDQTVLNEIFLGKLRGPDALARDTAPLGMPVQASADFLDLSAPHTAARLGPFQNQEQETPSRHLAVEDFRRHSIPVTDLGVQTLSQALSKLRDASIRDNGSFQDLVRRRMLLRTQPRIDESAAFMIRREQEPQLLRILNIPDTADSAVRNLSDGTQDLSILIVPVNSAGPDPKRLEQIVLRPTQEESMKAPASLSAIPETTPWETYRARLAEWITTRRTLNNRILAAALKGRSGQERPYRMTAAPGLVSLFLVSPVLAVFPALSYPQN